MRLDDDVIIVRAVILEQGHTPNAALRVEKRFLAEEPCGGPANLVEYRAVTSTATWFTVPLALQHAWQYRKDFSQNFD